MKKFSNIYFFCIFILFLNSCGGFSDVGKVLRDEKTRTTDEFLVKKKEPLTLPPDHSKIPEPDSLENNSEKEKSEINKIFKISKEKDSNKKRSSSIEKTVIDQIRK